MMYRPQLLNPLLIILAIPRPPSYRVTRLVVVVAGAEFEEFVFVGDEGEDPHLRVGGRGNDMTTGGESVR